MFSVRILTLLSQVLLRPQYCSDSNYFNLDSDRLSLLTRMSVRSGNFIGEKQWTEPAACQQGHEEQLEKLTIKGVAGFVKISQVLASSRSLVFRSLLPRVVRFIGSSIFTFHRFLTFPICFPVQSSFHSFFFFNSIADTFIQICGQRNRERQTHLFRLNPTDYIKSACVNTDTHGQKGAG